MADCDLAVLAAMPAGAGGARSDAAVGEELAAVRARLIRLAMKLIWHREDAEDMVQEACTLLLRATPPIASPQRPAWLWRTVSNLCLNHRRRRRPAPLSNIELTDGRQPENTAMEDEQAERLRAALEQLPDQQRVATVLRCMEGLTYEAVGEIMLISSAAARTHVHLARRRLAELMEVEHAAV